MRRIWFARNGSREIGPLTIAELKQIAAQGRLDKYSAFRRAGESKWQPIDKFSELSILVSSEEGGTSGHEPPMARADSFLPGAETGEYRNVGLSFGPLRPRPQISQGLIIIAAAFIGCLAMAMFIALAVILFDRPSKIAPVQPEAIPLIPASADSWTEQIAERSKRGVVQVRSGSRIGAGFVIATIGNRHLIVTNKHVLGEIDEIRRGNIPRSCTVITKSTDSLAAQVAAVAAKSDVDAALLLVESVELQTMGPIVGFDDVKVGEDVVAIGSPLGLDHTITRGIISEKRFSYLLQTDAAINHGNSGGPLMDRKGRIAGINTYLLIGEDSAGPGIGFAIRADWLPERSLWNFRLDVSDLMAAVPR